MKTDYELLKRQLVALLQGETDALANSAIFVALLFDALDTINWCGIYVLRDEELVLGPFQGRPACIRIPLGQGVCGSAAVGKQTFRVADVHEFEGHIVCDPVSRSEIVVPLQVQDRVLGVLDIDSPEPGRFTPADQAGIELLCESFTAHIRANQAGFI